MYDSNLFASPSNPRQTLVERLGPRVGLDRRAPGYTLVGRYELDGEYVQALPEEGIHLARQLGSIQFDYLPTRRFSFDLEAAYIDTRTPVELVSLSALDRGHVRTQRLSLGPAVKYALSRRTEVGAGYLFTHDTLLDLTADAHVAKGDLDYRFTHVDTGSVEMLVREFVIDGDALAPSEVALLGWTRRFTRTITASLKAGPRFRRGETDGVEVAAGLQTRFGRSEFDASYTRAETVTLGLPGPLETDAGLLSATLRFFEHGLFRCDAGVARTHGGATRADVLHTRLEARTQVYPALAVALAATLSWQHFQNAPLLGPAGTENLVADARVFHEILALTLVLAPPKPLEL